MLAVSWREPAAPDGHALASERLEPLRERGALPFALGVLPLQLRVLLLDRDRLEPRELREAHVRLLPFLEMEHLCLLRGELALLREPPCLVGVTKLGGAVAAPEELAEARLLQISSAGLGRTPADRRRHFRVDGLGLCSPAHRPEGRGERAEELRVLELVSELDADR